MSNDKDIQENAFFEATRTGSFDNDLYDRLIEHLAVDRTYEEKFHAYSQLPKRKLIDMLIASNDIIDRLLDA